MYVNKFEKNQLGLYLEKVLIQLVTIEAKLPRYLKGITK